MSDLAPRSFCWSVEPAYSAPFMLVSALISLAMVPWYGPHTDAGVVVPHASVIGTCTEFPSASSRSRSPVLRRSSFDRSGVRPAQRLIRGIATFMAVGIFPASQSQYRWLAG